MVDLLCTSYSEFVHFNRQPSRYENQFYLQNFLWPLSRRGAHLRDMVLTHKEYKLTKLYQIETAQRTPRLFKKYFKQWFPLSCLPLRLQKKDRGIISLCNAECPLMPPNFVCFQANFQNTACYAISVEQG